MTSSEIKASWNPIPKAIVFVVAVAVCLLAIQAEPTFAAKKHYKAFLYCPFCDAIKGTISDNLQSNDVSLYAVSQQDTIGKLGSPKQVKFKIIRLINNQTDRKFPELVSGNIITATTDQTLKVGQKVLLFGTLEFQLSWQTPVLVTEKSMKYLDVMGRLPEKGAVRIEAAYSYLENSDPLIADDAYNEFAKASYQAVIDAKKHYKRKQILGWIADKKVSNNRKRLYFTLLGICGTQEEIPFLKQRILNREPGSVIGLDAVIACYLTLAKTDGLELVDKEFLSNPKAEYAELFAAIAALRFHATEGGVIPQKDIIKSARKLLGRPKYADLIIPDLARWKDWESAERMMELFEKADDQTKWIRRSVVQFLLACPESISKPHLDKLRKSHPKVVSMAKRLYDLQTKINDDAEEDPFQKQLDALEKKTNDDKLGEDETEEKIFGDTKTDPPKNSSGQSKKNKKKNEQQSSNRVELKRPNFDATAKEAKTNSAAANVAESLDKTKKTASNEILLDAVKTDSAEPADHTGLRLWLVGLPILANLVLFALAWSILCGWFNRLFF